METRKTNEVIFRQDLYPRVSTEPSTIQRYADNLEVLPPIEINQQNILIDGFHRWTAHKKMESDIVQVTVTETKSDMEIYSLAIQRNASHGLQLSEKDKEKTAIVLYASGTGLSKEDIAKTLSVSGRMLRHYLEDTDRRLKEERKEKIFDLFLACYTQEEIAEAVDLHGGQLSEVIKECSDLETFPKQNKLSATFQDEDFKPPLYTFWSFASKTNEVKHFGNSEQRILENLLYLYTNPFDIILDPFAGGGATIDVCKKRLRRYFVSDRKPIIEREKEIRLLDICQDLPPLHKRWSEVMLTYLDPPYWKQSEGKYSKDAEDMANMPLEDFTEKLHHLIAGIADKQSKGAIALLMQPTQWNAPERNVVDHVLNAASSVNHTKLRLAYRIACPYSTEQCTPQQVQWAKDNKKLLVITRELIVWEFEQNDKG